MSFSSLTTPNNDQILPRESSRNLPNSSPSNSLKSTILSTIKTKKVVNSNYFRVYNLLLILGIAVLSFLSVFLLAGFLADLGEINKISDDFLGNFVQNSFLEFVVLAILIGVLIYVIYRQTDWILVRHKRALLAGILIFITIFGTLGSFVIHNHLETLQNLENLDYRKNRLANLGQKMKENQVFIGKITELNKVEKWLKITNKLETKTFYWQINEENKRQNSQEIDQTQNFPPKNSLPKINSNNSNQKQNSLENILPKNPRNELLKSLENSLEKDLEQSLETEKYTNLVQKTTSNLISNSISNLANIIKINPKEINPKNEQNLQSLQNWTKNDKIWELQLAKNQNQRNRKPRIRNLDKMISRLKIGQKVFVDFEEMEGKMFILNIKILYDL